MSATEDTRATRRSALKALSAVLAAPWLISSIRQSRAVTGVEADLAGVLPFDPQSLPPLRTPLRHVFAHWHVFRISADNEPPHVDYYARDFLSPDGFNGQYRNFGGYMRERPLPRPPRAEPDWVVQDMVDDVRLAQAIGIDAFLFNIVDIERKSPFWENLVAALEAARLIDSRLKIIPSVDGTSKLLDRPVEEIAEALKSIANQPGIMRTARGAMMLAAFMPERWPAARWKALFESLRRSNIEVSFFGVFLNFRSATQEHLALMDMTSAWAGNNIDGLPGLALQGLWARFAGVPWAAPVWPQDFRPKDGCYAETANSRLFRDSWHLAMKQDAPCVHLITWNDYSEGSEIRPSTGIQYAFYDLSAYYIAWYKSGVQPKITRDVLYYFHRVEPTSGKSLGTRQPKPIDLCFGKRPVNQVELLAFLAEPGRLEIEIGGRTTAIDADAGITSLRAPLTPGRPVFRLSRSGRNITTLDSAFEIRSRAEYQDLLYRGGSSTRPAVSTAPAAATPASSQ
jgi:hypothetical protein